MVCPLTRPPYQRGHIRQPVVGADLSRHRTEGIPASRVTAGCRCALLCLSGLEETSGVCPSDPRTSEEMAYERHLQDTDPVTSHTVRSTRRIRVCALPA